MHSNSGNGEPGTGNVEFPVRQVRRNLKLSHSASWLMPRIDSEVAWTLHSPFPVPRSPLLRSNSGNGERGTGNVGFPVRQVRRNLKLSHGASWLMPRIDSEVAWTLHSPFPVSRSPLLRSERGNGERGTGNVEFPLRQVQRDPTPSRAASQPMPRGDSEAAWMFHSLFPVPCSPLQ